MDTVAQENLDRLRQLAQAAMSELSAQEAFWPVMDAIPMALFFVDRSGRIIFANAQAELLFHCHRTAMVGELVETLLPERFREAHETYRGGYLTDPRVRPMGAGQPLFALNKDGEEIPVEISLGPIVLRSGLLILVALRRRRDGGDAT